MKVEIANNVGLLEQMLSDQETVSELYRPGPYWLPYQKRVVKAIREFGISSFRSSPRAGKGYADSSQRLPVDWDGTLKARIVAKLLKLKGIRRAYEDLERGYLGLRANLDQTTADLIWALHSEWLTRDIYEKGFPETKLGKNEGFVHFNGSEMSLFYLLLAVRLEVFRRQSKLTSPRVYFEIGGGFGAFTHLVLHWLPSVSKVIYLDIPPMIYVGTEYLRVHYPGAVRDYSETSMKKKIVFEKPADETEIICICSWQIEKLDENVDLFHNAASFSEMTPEIVSNYASYIGKLCGKNSELWLAMNKKQLNNNARITLPDEILTSFRPNFEMQSISAMEPVGSPLYYFGMSK